MLDFNRQYLEHFLAIVRKYMQMRGALSQKDLAELTEIGVSTMSRFLNQKTKELDPLLIANIVAKLQIPLHEIIDFIEEDYTEKFKRQIAFFNDEPIATTGAKSEEGEPYQRRGQDEEFDEAFESLGTAQKKTFATVKVGKRKTTIPFNEDSGARNSNLSLKEKLDKLTPRQKAYLSDFLNLDMEGKDLMVDLGNSLFRYFKQKGVEDF